MVYAILVGMALGLVGGGRLSDLSGLRFRWVPLAIGGFLLQVVLFSPPITGAVGDFGVLLYVGSTLLVLAVVVRNVDRARGLVLVALGAAANLVAIVANGGYMPALPEALRAAGRLAQGGYTNSVESATPNLT
ncbi:MAG TPA: DUF5317 family protein, partial [Candidatus Acidoferrum sp.]|nr:DUF5317 family protein [Candidatus Acidoferrum sp.]